MNFRQESEFNYEEVRNLTNSRIEGKCTAGGFEEEEAVDRLDRMSILDAISQCDAFRHTIR